MSARIHTFALALGGACVPIVSTVLTQVAEVPACVAVTPVPGPLGYSVRDGGIRCEGLYIAQVAATPIEVVSVYSQAVIGLSAAKILRIAAADASLHTPVLITGIATTPEVYYRVDARLTAEQPTIDIDGSAVLFRAGLQFSDLAFLGKQGDAILPLAITDPSQPSPAARSPTTIVIQLRTTRPLKQLHWRIERPQSTQQDWAAYPDDLSGPYRLANLRLGAGSGAADLVIKTEDASGRWSVSRIPMRLP